MGELTITREDGRTLVIDLVKDAQFSRSVILPTHPVDPGSTGGTGRTVNDSAKLESRDITCNCMVGAVAPAGALPDPRREEAALEFLESIVGEYVTVTLPKFRQLDDCQLAQFPYAWDIQARTPFTIVFRQSGFAGRTTTILPRVVARAKPDIPPEEDIGEQPTKTPTPEKEAEVNRSVLKRIFGPGDDQ